MLPIRKPRALKPCTKAGDASLTGHGALQQMWELAEPGRRTAAMRRAGGARSQER